MKISCTTFALMPLLASFAIAGSVSEPNQQGTGLLVQDNVPSEVNDNDDEIDCHEFFQHLDTLAHVVGHRAPTSLKRYNRQTCEMAYSRLQHNANAVNAVVNLGTHFENFSGDRRLLRSDQPVEDVASHLRKQRRLTKARERLTLKLFKDQSPSELSRQLLFNPFDTNSQADEIALCDAPADDQCPHIPCTPFYLVDTQLYLSQSTAPQVYTEFNPAYGGTFGYEFGTALLRVPWGTALNAISSDLLGGSSVAAANEVFWDQDPASRTSTSNIGYLLVALWTQEVAQTIAEAVCDAIPDDIEIPIICVDLPNPAKAVCEAVELVIKTAGLIIGSLNDQAAFQDSLVDGAEVEAAYENSRLLLDMECAIYDQARCRCQDETDPAGTYGQGCDGKDSDCDDIVDECDEDTVLPTIHIESAVAACSKGWFATAEEAIECVEKTVVVTDDCQETSEVFEAMGTCDETEILVTTVDACNPTTPVVGFIPVSVDGTAPTVECSVNGFKDLTLVVTGPGVFEDVELQYTASDDCDSPLEVSVAVYSNEIEPTSGPGLARFFQSNQSNEAGLYVAKDICSTDANGRCIKDPNANDLRIYTIVVTASDVAGNAATDECTVTIIPQGNAGGSGGTNGGGSGNNNGQGIPGGNSTGTPNADGNANGNGCSGQGNPNCSGSDQDGSGPVDPSSSTMSTQRFLVGTFSSTVNT